MPISETLLAWIEKPEEELFVAAFVSAEAATKRAPATQLCTSEQEARTWVQEQAAAFGIPVEWLRGPATD